MIILETERLFLRKWDLEHDFLPFLHIIQDPRVMEFLPALGNEVNAKRLIEHSNAHIDEHGYGLFACEVKDTKKLIGFVGLKNVDPKMPFAPCVEIGWRLAYDAWGKGYAPEAAKKCIELGFVEYGFPKIVAYTSKNNLRSRRVMEKLGMTYNPQDDFFHPNLDQNHELSLHVLYQSMNITGNESD